MNDKEIISNYSKNGFVLIKSFFKADQISSLKKDLLSNDFIKLGCEVYYESLSNKKKIRRIENFSDKFSKVKNLLNSKNLRHVLELILEDKPSIFKEKINFKSAKVGSEFRFHIDGHFYWNDKNNRQRKGWKEYANNFVNLVIPFEKTDKNNGCLKILPREETLNFGKNWDEITSKLKDKGPFLKENYLFKSNENIIEMMPGDILLFDWLCIHGSDNNDSSFDRPIMYLTFNCESDGNLMNKYFSDKNSSLAQNDEKSLI